jgi:transcriptional regulator with XRE-family HTH domain
MSDLYRIGGLGSVIVNIELTYNSTSDKVQGRKDREPIMASFGELLKEKRRKAGVTQRELAAQARLDFSYISKLENDRLPPPAAETTVTICKVLSIEPAELLAASRKLTADIQSRVSSSTAAQSFLLDASRMSLTEREWKKLTSSLHRLRRT